MLRRIVLENFKSFARAEAEISPFTLLVGANASGKSNFLDALRFLHGLSQGWTIHEVATGRFEGNTRVWPGIRGGGRELLRQGSTRARIDTEWERILGDGYRYSVAFDGAAITEESCENLFSARQVAGLGGDDQLEITWLPGAMVTPGQQGASHGPADRSVLAGQFTSDWLKPFRAMLQSIYFASPSTGGMRDFVEILPRKRGPAALHENGQNLSAVLYDLTRDDETRREIVDWLVEFCAPEIEDIEFERTESGFVMLRVKERSGALVSARSMSDGTLRFLSLLVAMRGSQPLTVIEDLESGFHPSRLRLLVDAISTWTTPSLPEGDAPMLVATTHSPELVEAALACPHATVLLCARSADRPGTILRDVRTLPDFEEVHRRRDFAYLLNTGWLERGA